MMPQSVPINHHTQFSPDQGEAQDIIRDLIDRRFFSETEQYGKLADWLNKRRRYKSWGIISGARGAGKSRASQKYDQVANGQRGPLRRVKPLPSFYLKGFTGWGTRDICNHTLKRFNHGARKGKPDDIRFRTKDVFEEFGLELLLVDNAHLVSDKALQDLVECYSCNKDGDDFRIAIVLIGPDKDLDEKLKRLGLRNKFGSEHKFKSLSPRQLVNVIKDFQKNFLGLPKEMEFFDGEIIAALCQASGGNLTILDKAGCDFDIITEILVLSIAQSSEDGVLRLDKPVLEEVLCDFGVYLEPIVEEPDDTEPGAAG